MQALLNHCEIANVAVTEFSATRTGDPIGTSDVNVAHETSYFVTDGAFANRFAWSVDVVNADGDDIAQFTATVVVEYDVSPGFVADEEAAQMIAETTGFFAAYPYVREILQSNSARLQLNPLVLGLLMKGARQPRSAE